MGGLGGGGCYRSHLVGVHRGVENRLLPPRPAWRRRRCPATARFPWRRRRFPWWEGCTSPNGTWWGCLTWRGHIEHGVDQVPSRECWLLSMRGHHPHRGGSHHHLRNWGSAVCAPAPTSTPSTPSTSVLSILARRLPPRYPQLRPVDNLQHTNEGERSMVRPMSSMRWGDAGGGICWRIN